MIRTYHRTLDGTQVAEHDAFDSRGLLRDGYTMRSKVMLRDGVPSPVADAAEVLRKREQIDRYNARIGDAWRNPPAVVDTVDARSAAHAKLGNVYERYEQRLVDAWRS